MKPQTLSYIALFLGAIIAVADVIWTVQSYYDTFWLALGIIIFIADIAWIYIDYDLMKGGKNMKNGLAIISVLVIILVLAGVGYYYYSNMIPAVTNSTVASTLSTTVASTASTTVAAGSTAASSTVATTTVSAAKPSVNENSSTKVGGEYLTTFAGYTLYTFNGDTKGSGTSACTGGCASSWPPYYNATVVVPSGLNASSFSTITTDGVKQLTYKGLPLYTFVGDSNPGQITGNGVGGFSVAKP